MKLIERYYKTELGHSIEEYLIDTDAELASLPKAPVGSYAISVESGKKFFINSSGEWPDPSKYVGGGGGSTGGGGDIDALIDGSITEVSTKATKIRDYSFYKNGTLTGINMPNVNTIGYSAFNGCTALNKIVLPDTLSSIDRHAFNGCKNLVIDEFPNNLVAIGMSAFVDCINLSIKKIPQSIKTIDGSVFMDCKGLTSITFEGKPNDIASDAFYGCTNLLTINVPWAAGAVARAPWGATNATINYNYTGV